MWWHCVLCFRLNCPGLLPLSVVMQPKSQHHREPDSKDESEALQEPQVVLLVALSPSVLLEVRGGLVCSAAAADLWENVHRSHIEECPS